MTNGSVLVEMEKIYRPSRMWDELLLATYMGDLTFPTFWKFKAFKQARCRTCDMGGGKWF